MVQTGSPVFDHELDRILATVRRHGASISSLSEAFASDLVLNFVWDSGRLRFPAFILAFSTAIERFYYLRASFFGRFPRGLRSPGLQRVFSRARVSESHAADERGDPELEGYLLRRGHTELLFSVVLEMYFCYCSKKAPTVARVSVVYSGSEQLEGFIICSEDFLLVRADSPVSCARPTTY